ncbi:MAG: response regulator, partial [Verrucomicrobia bacterium]|nr:response regulator [Verrucomicrobiota bacterium]
MKDHQTSHLGTPTVGQAADAAVKLHRILVVDDDDSIRQLNTAVLTRAGYTVDAAEDGVVAWHALNAESYDLLITDNNMPALTGIELLQKMRAARMCLPVIVASGTFL